MSYTNTVLTAMRVGCIYRVCDLAAATQLPADDVRRILGMLSRGGLVDEIRGDGYRRKRMYSTRQRELRL